MALNNNHWVESAPYLNQLHELCRKHSLTYQVECDQSDQRDAFYVSIKTLPDPENFTRVEKIMTFGVGSPLKTVSQVALSWVKQHYRDEPSEE